MSNEIPLRPILARNMTARADYLVPGNPMIARPESGVGNAHPGLEFDVRALDRHFLPGLVFDYQFGIGAKLVSIDRTRFAASTVTDQEIADGLYLWAVRARFGDDPGRDQAVNLAGIDGYMVLRRIMDLEPGNIAVAVGPAPDTEATKSAAAQACVALAPGAPLPADQRDAGKLVFGTFSGQRADYLDADGVIDPVLLPPGEITQNLCSPWQWDFADCYCYYWASSKPDIVVGVTGDAQILNFQRDRTLPEPTRPSPDPKVWQAGNISEPDLIVSWEDLPIVTSDREGVVPRLPHWPLMDQPMELAQMGDELEKLADLEHALCVEYLFARYSIRAARDAPMAVFKAALDRHRSAHEIFNVAKDEMRHFRWVNEALRLLNRPARMGRAKVIGRDLERNFELRPLLPGTLDEFIGIEAPSSVFNDDPQQLDGVYTRILVSLHHLERKPGANLDMLRRLQQLMKVIIDEGESHWERFRRVKEQLGGQKPKSYLRYLETPGMSTSEPQRGLQLLADAFYDLLLHALYITFTLGRGSRGAWLMISHQAMFALDDTAFLLADLGSAARFNPPGWLDQNVPTGFPTDIDARIRRGARNFTLSDVIGPEANIDRMFDPAETMLRSVQGNSKAKALVAELQKRIAAMKALVKQKY
jgi:hypothetical protein